MGIRTTSTTGQSYEYTSQLYFDDSMSDQVFTHQPYASRGNRDTKNSDDGIYWDGGSKFTLVPTKSDDGYTATSSIVLDLVGQLLIQQRARKPVCRCIDRPLNCCYDVEYSTGR